MEIVIKIPEEAYQLLKNKGVDWLGAEHILNAVANGTPLPKGHGDLIDRKELLKEKRRLEAFDGDVFDIIHEETVINAQTIIEADKENT